MSQRLTIKKTYKMFIGGKFVRSESCHSFKILDQHGKLVANACRSTRKDVRDAVRSARGAVSWEKMAPYNRGQILYRLAEMMEGKKAEFTKELSYHMSPAQATEEVENSINRVIWYAGWADKYVQISGTVNPVAPPYFSFSVPEPTGVVGIICPDVAPLLALITLVMPALVGGNTVVVVGSTIAANVVSVFSEAVATSDLPSGVLNILTGYRQEVIESLSGHMDVNALVLGIDESSKQIEENGVENVKRIVKRWLTVEEWTKPELTEKPAFIDDTTEIKTLWHPIGL